MIAVDTNILVYSHREDSTFHFRAAEAVKTLAESPSDWAIPWPCIYEFYAIVTHPKIYSPPTPSRDALQQIEAWLESPSLILPGEPYGGYWPMLRHLIEAADINGPQVHDARVAALCLAHHVEILWSADRDFSRFPGLRIENPLL
jgi:uncharacterized protein